MGLSTCRTKYASPEAVSSESLGQPVPSQGLTSQFLDPSWTLRFMCSPGDRMASMEEVLRSHSTDEETRDGEGLA